MSNIFVNIKESLPMTPKPNAYYSYCVADPPSLGISHKHVTSVITGKKGVLITIQ